ncbi:Fic family protein [Acetobacter oryzoeni]|uniref:Fic family protein n=1 Tax=Acetobacter oryzoeni TaxID=2500548 RepID=A0A5B9GFC3_9PROT|nr:Fic family protein [Acetobacter oryzoeni]MCP1201860.1 Fic family protein [Acetobacter oryzoeni]QEE84643.1 Fic family protein [Acetobacter oryzoeni]
MLSEGSVPAKTLLETPSKMTPLILSGSISALMSDLAAEVSAAAAELTASIHPITLGSAANLTRIMNCYYSNLIEGHRTRPLSVEDVINNGTIIKGREDEEKISLAIAHINVQKYIDDLHCCGMMDDPASIEFISTIHRKFYAELGGVFLDIKSPDTGDVKRRMQPGIFRQEGEDVEVGRHRPPLGGQSVLNFLNLYQENYKRDKLGHFRKAQRLYAIAAAHHRFSYIHPFDDGNGRVARLLTHAMMLDAGFGAKGFWSMSRGLARGLPSDAPIVPPFIARLCGAAAPTQQYKFMMAHADMPRQGSLDGRGNLSEKALCEFCEWFLAIALDQITFMSKHLNKNSLIRNIITKYIPMRGLDVRSSKILEQIVISGEIPRASVKSLLDVSSRTASTLIAALIKDGIVASNSHKDPLYLNFSVSSSEILIPGLFSVEALSE